MYAWIEFADIRKTIALSKLCLHFVQMAGAEDGTDNWRHAEADAEGMIGTMMTLFSEMAIFVHFFASNSLFASLSDAQMKPEVVRNETNFVLHEKECTRHLEN